METFEFYSRQVYAWAYRLLGRHHDALDVVQDVFIRWSRQCADQQPDRPAGWLRRVTVNRAIDVRKARRRHGQLEESPDPRAGAAAEQLARGDLETLRSDIVAALDSLTDVQRNVLVAKVYDAITFSQIASELGLAISTVQKSVANPGYG